MSKSLNRLRNPTRSQCFSHSVIPLFHSTLTSHLSDSSSRTPELSQYFILPRPLSYPTCPQCYRLRVIFFLVCYDSLLLPRCNSVRVLPGVWHSDDDGREAQVFPGPGGVCLWSSQSLYGYNKYLLINISCDSEQQRMTPRPASLLRQIDEPVM